MKLAQLVRVLTPTVSRPLPPAILDMEISRVTDKSNDVIPGALFVAYPGVNVDGAKFIPDAIRRGAAVVVSQSGLSGAAAPIPVLQVENGRSALAHLAAAFFKYPSRNLRVIGVTGTDGKTTTSTLIENILLAAGHSVGTITTVAAHIGGQEVDTGFHTTTPDAPDLQSYLAQMVEQGTEYAVIESTSHGLAQHRLDAVDFDIAVVTNITHEHLDLHGSWEKYRDAKARLFRALDATRRKPRTQKVAVLNADDTTRGVFDYLRELPCDERVIYRLDRSDLSARDLEVVITGREIRHSAAGLQFVVDTPFGELNIESPLIGRYNSANILAAVGAAIGRRIPFAAIEQGVRMTRGIVGRMEKMEGAAGFTVIVDFAHTPYALENALKTARELTTAQGRVISVFGCAGLRDEQKRAWMGKVSGTLADLTVVTAEDPRTESLTRINQEIAGGLQQAGRAAGRDYFVIDDRAEAIQFAITELARRGDVVMICGKGHEHSMCFGTTEYPWSDQEAAQKAIQRISDLSV